MGVALSAGPACPASGCSHHCPRRLSASSARQPLPNLPLCPGSRREAPQLFSTPMSCIFSRLRTDGAQSLLPRAQSLDGFDLLSLSQTNHFTESPRLSSPTHRILHFSLLLLRAAGGAEFAGILETGLVLLSPPVQGLVLLRKTRSLTDTLCSEDETSHPGHCAT